MSKKLPFLSLVIETETIGDSLRARTAGDFVRLEDGYTHYELSGPVDAQVVVLVHGFSAPYFIWEPTFKAIAQAGFRVLRYDLYGRGFSDRPRLRYEIDLFRRQLRQLLDALNLSQPLALIAFSMGATIALSFIDKYPKRVRKLALIGPAGARAINYLRLLKTHISSRANTVKYIKEYLEPYQVQMRYRGFKRALVSTISNGMLGDFSGLYRRVGEQKRPVQLIWGCQDSTITFEDIQIIQESMPDVEFHPFTDGGHLTHFEKPEAVNPILIKFLNNGSE
ncbi:MAG: alpha/beta fold hydrolase [Anaerolineales bacterium]|nr:MAG: alpha/beta fold hydrolase [Anaerolineales bacterium]